MMPNFNDTRGGYDDPDQRQGRPFDQRFVQRGQSFGPGLSFERSGQRFERQPQEGDWMRASRWGREDMQRRDQAQPGAAPLVKVIEIVAQSPHSWEDAARRAVAEASRTIRGIRSIYVKDMQAIVDDNQVICFRINAKISFALDDDRRRR